MTRMLAKAVFISIALSLTSCASAKFTVTNKQCPPYQGVVKVFTETPKDLKYEEIGWVSGEGMASGGHHGLLTSCIGGKQWAEVIASMQKKAAQYGANAIIIQSMDKDKNVSGMGGQGYWAVDTPTRKELLGIAIRIKE